MLELSVQISSFSAVNQNQAVTPETETIADPQSTDETVREQSSEEDGQVTEVPQSHTKPNSGETKLMEGQIDSDNNREEGEVIFASVVGQFTCSVCNEVIGGEEDLSSHHCKVKLPRRVKAEKDDGALSIFTCNICNKSFDKENYLKRHIEGILFINL